MASMSSAQIVSASVIHSKNLSGPSNFASNETQQQSYQVIKRIIINLFKKMKYAEEHEKYPTVF